MIVLMDDEHVEQGAEEKKDIIKNTAVLDAIRERLDDSTFIVVSTSGVAEDKEPS